MLFPSCFLFCFFFNFMHLVFSKKEGNNMYYVLSTFNVVNSQQNFQLLITNMIKRQEKGHQSMSMNL